MIILVALCFMQIENTKDFKHKRGIEKENMREGIIKRNSIIDCDI